MKDQQSKRKKRKSIAMDVDMMRSIAQEAECKELGHSPEGCEHQAMPMGRPVSSVEKELELLKRLKSHKTEED